MTTSARPPTAKSGRRPAPGPVAVQAEETPGARRVAHLSVAERVARGRAARNQTPRRSHASWGSAGVRADPMALLEAQGETRVTELLPIRYGRMSVSPFTFFRGGAAIMAADLAASPRSGLVAQLCGDAHLSNFGSFLSPERVLLFDINDFDETLPGPWEWDLKRLVASYEVGGRSRGFSASTRRRLVHTAVASYQSAIATFAAETNVDVWYARLSIDAFLASQGGGPRPRRGNGVERRETKRVRRLANTARSKHSLRAFSKLVRLTSEGEPRIVSDPPLVVSLRELANDQEVAEVQNAIAAVLRAYRSTLPEDRKHLLEQYHVVDVARKVVGVGSVGTRAWIVLAMGRDGSDPLFLQFKEAQKSVLESHLGRSRFANHGRRVVEGQRLMQSASDVMLGWTRVMGADGIARDYYVRQLWDGKGSLDPDTATEEALTTNARACAWTLARAHARSGDAVAIASYVGRSGTLAEALAAFATEYADQNERDHAALLAAIKSGRLPAEMGV